MSQIVLELALILVTVEVLDLAFAVRLNQDTARSHLFGFSFVDAVEVVAECLQLELLAFVGVTFFFCCMSFGPQKPTFEFV